MLLYLEVLWQNMLWKIFLGKSAFTKACSYTPATSRKRNCDIMKKQKKKLEKEKETWKRNCDNFSVNL